MNKMEKQVAFRKNQFVKKKCFKTTFLCELYKVGILRKLGEYTRRT